MKGTASLAALAALAVLVAPASADTTSTGTTTTLASCTGGDLQVTRVSSTTGRPSTEDPLVISSSDCSAGVALRFDYTYAGAPSDQLQVWGLHAGQSATECFSAARTSGAGCDLFNHPGPIGTSGTFEIDGADLASLVSTVNACVDSGTTTEPNSVMLYVLAAPSADDASQYCVYEADVDLLGPGAPGTPTLGPEDAALLVDFALAEDSDVAHYNIYCDDGVTPLGGGGAGGGGSGGKAEKGDAGKGGGAGGGGAGGGGGASPSECTGSALRPGQKPDPTLLVATASGSHVSVDRANDRPMRNDVTYACAVTAVDAVGNEGKLSSVVCGTPRPNDDFFGSYRDAGGRAGGGLCAIGRGPTTFATMSFAIVAAGLAVAARRRARRRVKCRTISTPIR